MPSFRAERGPEYNVRVTIPANAQAIVDWLIAGAPSAPTPQDVLQQLSERLMASGVPLSRVAVFVRTLHPQIIGRQFIWRPGEPVGTFEAEHSRFHDEDIQRSPVLHLYRTGEAVRRRLIDPQSPNDFPYLDEARAEGTTDYFVFPLKFINGEMHAVSCSTTAPAGFSVADMAVLEAIEDPLARVAEAWALRRTAATLLNTYVGTHSGERILAGHIQRGDVESIHAVIWLSDMRGFTALSDRLPPRRVIDILNRYFDCQVGPITDHGGEVLKFIGDGLLAIFPVATDQSDAEWVCGEVLEVARKVRGRIAALRSDQETEGAGEVRFGVALHLGEVLYGNIGGGNRLDFTCIGPAVNLAARLEKVAGRLGHAVVTSAAFARYCPAQVRPLGEFALQGFSAEQPAFLFPET